MKRNSHKGKSSPTTVVLSEMILPTSSSATATEMELVSDDNGSDGSTVLIDTEEDDDSTMLFHKSNSTWGTAMSSSMSSSTSMMSATKSNDRSVSFAPFMNQEYDNTVMCKEELSTLWYTSAEYTTFRSMALDAAQQIIATEKRNRAPHSYQRVMERTYNACCIYTDTTTTNTNNMVVPDNLNCDSDDDDMPSIPTIVADDDTESDSSRSASTTLYYNVISDEDFVHLQRWLEVGSSRIGLEKWSIRTISTARATRREMMVDVVLSIQQQQQQQQRIGCKKFNHKSKQQPIEFIDCDHIWNNDAMSRSSSSFAQPDDTVTAEAIRETCERLSRPSCLFSHVMACGLAAAVVKERNC